MALLFFKIKQFTPDYFYKTVFDIDYSKLYDEGKRIILFDVDNTLIPYDVSLPSIELADLLDHIQQIGFKIILISNNRKQRIELFANACQLEYVYSATKPLKRGYKKVFKMLGIYDKSEMIAIGDQIMTDVFGAKRVKISVVLVKAIKKRSEKWYTKINRFMEKQILKKMKKKNIKMYNLITEVDDNIEK